MTTLISYGEVDYRRQGEIIRDLANPQRTASPDVTEIVKAVVHEMRQSDCKG